MQKLHDIVSLIISTLYIGVLSDEGSNFAHSSANIQALEIKKYLENIKNAILDFSYLIECSQPGTVPSPTLIGAIFNLVRIKPQWS